MAVEAIDVLADPEFTMIEVQKRAGFRTVRLGGIYVGRLLKGSASTLLAP
jgi:hypothetical protein